jgi:acylphosphatase
MDTPRRRIVRVLIRGSVQRVGFRMWMEREALVRGVEGWVRNRADGDVEAVFAGEAEAVDSLVAACSSGPPGARVANVDVLEASEADIALRGVSTIFDVLPTVL